MGKTTTSPKKSVATELFELLAGAAQNGRPSTSFADSLDDSMKRITEAFKSSKPIKNTIKDSYGNSLTATGVDDKVKSFTTYGFNNDTMNYPLWTALYNDSWVFKKAIDKPAEDMVRCGIELKCDSTEKEKVYDDLDALSFSLIKLLSWGALYGGSIGLMQFDTFKDEDYAKPLKDNEQKIKNAKVIRLYVTDRWYGCAKHDSKVVTDFADLDFGKPESYNITYANGTTIVARHEYCLRYEHRTAPNLVKNGILQGWGYAEGSHILNELSRDDQLKSAITSLVNKSLIEVIKMAGMRGVFMGAENENEEQLRKRLEMVNWARTFNSLTFLDKDDEYQEHGFSGLSGLADLLDKNMVLISAATDMPGILFGDISKGFAVDKDALKRYANNILGRCESYYKPVMDKLLTTLYMKYGISEKVSYDFISLAADDEKNDKLEAVKNFRQICSDLLGDGVLTTKQYAKAFQKFVATGEIDFGLTDDVVNKLPDEFENQMENIDLGAK